MMQQTVDHVHSGVEKLLFEIERSIRYHRSRESFFDFCNRMIMLTTIMTGGGTIWFVKSELDGLAQVSAGLASFVTALGLVFELAVKARNHQVLRIRFSDIEIEIQQISRKNWTIANLETWNASVLVIEKDEPPTYVALNAKCRNDVIRAHEDYKNAPTEIVPWYINIFRHLLTFDSAQFPLTSPTLRNEERSEVVMQPSLSIVGRGRVRRVEKRITPVRVKRRKLEVRSNSV